MEGPVTDRILFDDHVPDDPAGPIRLTRYRDGSILVETNADPDGYLDQYGLLDAAQARRLAAWLNHVTSR